MTYRTGRHWGVTIVREGEQGSLFGHDAGPAYEHGSGCLWPNDTCTGHADGQRGEDQLVAVVVNQDQALAERICALLNGDQDAQPRATQDQINAARGIVPMTVEEARQVVRAVLDLRYVSADSCTCTVTGPDPTCIVHQGRRARGPKPPPLGPSCICDGSGRTCPRHGAVI